MRDFFSITSHFGVRTILACLALILLVAGTVHCDNSDQAVKDDGAGTVDALDQKVQDIKNQYTTVSTCAMCRKEAIGKTVCRMRTDPGQTAKTCCAGCGVKMLKRMGHQKGGSTVCYNTGQRVDLRKAYYVVGSDVKTCCSPSVLAFYDLQEAEKFMASHHGEIKQFKDM